MNSVFAQITNPAFGGRKKMLLSCKPTPKDVMELCMYTRGAKKGTVNEKKLKNLKEACDWWQSAIYTTRCGKVKYANPENYHQTRASHKNIRGQVEMDLMLQIGFNNFIRLFDLNKGIWKQWARHKLYPDHEYYWDYLQKTVWKDGCGYGNNGSVVRYI